MAKSRRAPAKTTKKAPAKKHRGGKSTKAGTSGRLWERIREWFTPAVIGGVLLAVGLFFTASFLSGRGAWLGETGLAGATRLLGVVGYALAPLLALVGGLLLAGRLPLKRTVGAILILLGFATTRAAALPEQQLFEPGRYVEAGGILGSAIYSSVYWTSGVVGAAVALVVLYALGLSLLTGISFEVAADGFRAFAGSFGARVSEWRARRTAAHEARASEERLKPVSGPPDRSATSRKASKTTPSQGVVDLYPELDAQEPAAPLTQEEPESFEIVLPESRDSLAPREEREEPDTGEYVPPSMSLLKLGGRDPEHDAEGTSHRLTQALSDLGVAAQVIRAVVGPRVTRYELRLGSGVKVGKISNLQQDIAYALAATEVRILAPIPGKSAVGVEVPNTRPATVTLGDVFEDYPEGNDWALPVGLGKDISGRPVFLDLADMPHLLVAGTTGSGKSVMLNGLLTSLLLATDPRQVKMVLIDPKRVELSQFARIPHLITPVVTDVKKAANALGWAVSEMERRYEVLEQKGVRSLEGYNARAEHPMPYVLVVIDELADLMMQAGAKVEDAIVRLAQKARAVGIHLVVATQRPSVDVITGMIKANIPSRIAFAVSSQVDSRVILDTSGAEALLGMGDMLYKPVSAARASRVQGAYISEPEVERIVSASIAAARGKAETKYVEEVTAPKKEKEEPGEPEDELLPEAASFVVSTQQASVSAVQRRFRVGYSRAGRIIDALERKGI
ncbi:MAG TPA: DNA translocase FtsK, partial [Rubrobacteraceae bacterium]|nr:DNA translocase FtsK [Rubrobacteraceae bacterium]